MKTARVVGLVLLCTVGGWSATAFEGGRLGWYERDGEMVPGVAHIITIVWPIGLAIALGQEAVRAGRKARP